MNAIKRAAAVACAIATLAGGSLALSGCGNSSDTAQEENPKSITVWHYEENSGAMGHAWSLAMKNFTKRTGIKVKFEKKSFEQIRQNASQILNSDQAPDVIEYNKGNATAGLLASQGLLTNLDSYVKKYGWNKKIPGSLAATGRYSDKGIMGSGHWYGITNYGEFLGLYYNKDMFDKYGIAIPKTYDELVSAMQKFKDAGVTPLSEGVQEYPLQHLWWQLVLNNASDQFLKAYEMYDGKVDWQGKALKQATQTVKDWVDKGYISKSSTGLKAEDAGQNFENGKYPIFYSGSWWYGRFQTELKGKMNWDYEVWPGAKRVPGSSGNIWVIPTASKKKDAAAKFINETLTPAVQNDMGNHGGLPIAAQTNAITDASNRKLVEQFSGIVKKNMLGFYPDWPTATFYDELNAGLQELVNGSKSVDGVLTELESNYNKGVKAAGYSK